MEDYSEFRLQVIEVDDDNYPSPENISQINNTTTTAEIKYNWTGAEVIIFPLLARKLHDTPSSFKKYSQKDIMKMSNLDLF